LDLGWGCRACGGVTKEDAKENPREEKRGEPKKINGCGWVECCIVLVGKTKKDPAASHVEQSKKNQSIRKSECVFVLHPVPNWVRCSRKIDDLYRSVN
jgi:hypothetical protein